MKQRTRVESRSSKLNPTGKNENSRKDVMQTPEPSKITENEENDSSNSVHSVDYNLDNQNPVLDDSKIECDSIQKEETHSREHSIQFVHSPNTILGSSDSYLNKIEYTAVEESKVAFTMNSQTKSHNAIVTASDRTEHKSFSTTHSRINRRSSEKISQSVQLSRASQLPSSFHSNHSSQTSNSGNVQSTYGSMNVHQSTHIKPFLNTNLNSNMSSKSFFSHLSDQYHYSGDPNIVKKGPSFLLRLPKQKYIFASKKAKKNVQKINGVIDAPILLEISSLLNKMCYVVSMNSANEENKSLMEQLELFQQQCWETERLNKRGSGNNDDALLGRIKKDSLHDLQSPTVPNRTSSFQSFGNLNESGVSEAFSIRMHDIYQYQMETLKLQKMQK